MKNNLIIMAIAILVVLDMIAKGTSPEERANPTHSALENEDGAVNMSELSDTEDVMDSAGAFVGVVRVSDELIGIYPLPVYGPDGGIVGYVGENGFWALGDKPPVTDE